MFYEWHFSLQGSLLQTSPLPTAPLSGLLTQGQHSDVSRPVHQQLSDIPRMTIKHCTFLVNEYPCTFNCGMLLQDLEYREGILVAGSLDALIELLIPTETHYPEKTYSYAFILCSRLFIRPYELLARVSRVSKSSSLCVCVCMCVCMCVCVCVC